MTAPSRQFMIQQAVLNACKCMWRHSSPAEVLRQIDYESYGAAANGSMLFGMVRSEFACISSQYEVRAA